MKYWTRTTHNFNNETREWEFCEEFSNSKIEEKTPLGIHALDSGRWSSLNEIIGENIEYCKYWPDNKEPTKEDVLSDLEQLEKLGLVRSREQ